MRCGWCDVEQEWRYWKDSRQLTSYDCTPALPNAVATRRHTWWKSCEGYPSCPDEGDHRCVSASFPRAAAYASILSICRCCASTTPFISVFRCVRAWRQFSFLLLRVFCVDSAPPPSECDTLPRAWLLQLWGCCSIIKALIRIYQGSIKALSKLKKGMR